MAAAIERWRPWAIVNASGYVRIDDAESDAERCLRENAIGPAVLADACAGAGIRLVTFSSDQVFDGRGDRPWVESDLPAPLNVYGASKADGEREALARCPAAMVVRTSAFFGPWDRHNFVFHAAERAEPSANRFAPPPISASRRPTCPTSSTSASICSSTAKAGIWHLANVGDVSWAELAARAATLARVSTETLQPCTSAVLGQVAARPRNGVLASERAALMPSLDDALRRFLDERVVADEAQAGGEQDAAIRSPQRAAGA